MRRKSSRAIWRPCERIAGPRGTGKPLQIAGWRAGHTTVGGDNCTRLRWLNRDRTAPPPTTPEQASAKPETLHGLSDDTRPEPETAFHRPRLFARASPRARRGKGRGRDHRCRPRLARRSKPVIPDTKNGLWWTHLSSPRRRWPLAKIDDRHGTPDCKPRTCVDYRWQ